jgi:hypothetical protein
LSIIAEYGETEADNLPHRGKILPNPSICGWVYENARELYAPDAVNHLFYRACNWRTKSEFALPVFAHPPRAAAAQPNNVTAVLNLESDELSGFSEAELAVARVGVQIASQHVALLIAKASIVWSLTPSDSALQDVLKDIDVQLHYPYGLVYIADYEHALLRVRARQVRPAVPQDEFSFEFRARSLASMVFSAGAHRFVPDAATDLHTNQDGVRRFQIAGPILAVPFRVKDLPVGVVVLWGKSAASAPSSNELSEIEACIRRYVRGEATQYLQAAMHHLRELRLILCTEKSEANILRAILGAIKAVGFSRARICKVATRAPLTYECAASLGVDPENALRGRSIANCHAVIYTRVDGSRIFDGQCFDPREGRTKPDPNAELLSKPIDLPYANVPLWHGNSLLGFIGADNKPSDPNERPRPIQRLHIETLEMIAGLAAPSVAAFWPGIPHVTE